MKAAIQACWNGYADELGSQPGKRTSAFRGPLPDAGARLVQTALEGTQYLQQPDSGAVLHLQLAFNVMRRPEAAVTQLLQIPFRGSRP